MAYNLGIFKVIPQKYRHVPQKEGKKELRDDAYGITKTLKTHWNSRKP